MSTPPPSAAPGREALLGALEVAERSARDAGELLLRHLGQLDETRIGSKSAARDLVTQLDLASERLIVPRLREAFPDHAIEAEEETHDEGTGGLRWFVDPLDGTVNYVHGIPFFCVSIALYLDDEPLVAVVHAPRLGETFTAVRGEGAWLAGPGEGVKTLSVSKAASLGEAVLCTGFPYRRGELKHDNLANLGRLFYDVRGIRRLGSAALDLAYVAAGRLDAFWELHLQPHDLAAGALLVR
ncbi:MAG: inositol monophosphatase family protein, partial [Planctomycetota bacterium]